MLAVVEQIARSQPIGVRALARALDIEKSAVQRAVATLAEAGWIQSPSGSAGSWELTGRILHVAHLAHGSNTLRHRARPILDALRDQTGETIYLAIPDAGDFVVMEVAESRHALRLVMPVGTILPGADSAAGSAVSPHVAPNGQPEPGDRNADAAPHASNRAVHDDFVVRDDRADANSISIAAPIFDLHAQPVGALVIYAVRARVALEDLDRLGRLLAARSREISAFGQTEVRLADLRHAIGSFG